VKISYLLPTIKPNQFALRLIEDIKNLPKHDYEIVLISPDSRWCENSDIKFIHEKQKQGTVKATNEAYKNSSGDFIVCLTDDHRFGSNFLDFLNSALSEEVSKEKIRIGNACVTFGRYGDVSFHKPTKTFSKFHPTTLVVPEEIPCKPYSIVCFPMVFKEDVEKYMRGIIFNESFMSFYADSWMGYFAEHHNKKCVNWPVDVWVDSQPCNSQYEANKEQEPKDHSTFLKMIKKFNEDPDIPYDFNIV
jgi:glycosyltransferase involved in cell wall biosynthesis